MKTNLQHDTDRTTIGTPETPQQELLHVIGSGEVCQECLNEDFDSCVCPEQGS